MVENGASHASRLGRGLLASFVIVPWCASAVLGQLPKRLERCLPYPTLAQEIRDMRREMEPQTVTVHVARVEFDKTSGIPVEIQREISGELKRHILAEDAAPDYLKEAADEIAWVGVTLPLQKHGYFKASSKASLTELETGNLETSVAVRISAEPGPQYRVGRIEIKAADSKWLSLLTKALRERIPLQAGEILNADKLRAGLRNLTKTYGRFGFIDMTAEPEFKIDDLKKVIDITILIDEQKQYWLGAVEFLGVDPAVKAKLEASIRGSGRIFDSSRLDQFFRTNRGLLPPNASLEDDLSIQRNTKEGTVSLRFDFRPCPGQVNP
jgi:hypothetical protein